MDAKAAGYAVASISFGKDSLAMCIGLIERGERLDEIVFYNTGMEFEAIYKERDRWAPWFEAHGVKFTELQPRRPFLADMFCTPIHSRGGQLKAGYGWCGGPCRWGTSNKTSALDKHMRGAGVQYVGIAADEKRPLDPAKKYPLIEWGMTEADCLQFCYDHGAEWAEGNIRLYDVLKRVSCWCCRNKNKKELRAIRDYLPQYWERLVCMEMRIGKPMKNKPLLELFDEQGRLF